MSSPVAIKLGFTFVPMPCEIWDQAIDLSLGEFRLLGYLIRHQVQFGQKPEPMSDDEVLNGRWSKDWVRLDKGCGLTSRNGLKTARELLISRGWIQAENTSDDPNRPKWMYTVLIAAPETGVTARQQVSQHDTYLSQRDTKVSQRDTTILKEEDSVLDTGIETPPSSVPSEDAAAPKKTEKDQALSELHGRIRTYIQKKYEKRFKITCPWDASEAGMLSKLLKSAPKSWSVDDWKRMVDNRFASENITSERPRVWLKQLESYHAGPLDRFGKLKAGATGGNGRQVVEPPVTPASKVDEMIRRMRPVSSGDAS